MTVAIEVIGDSWSMLIVRDIVFYGKHTFGEFLASKERITTSVLADRLAFLLSEGVLAKQRDPQDRRREHYDLTDKGLALIPVLIELANWGVEYGPEVVPNPAWVAKAAGDPSGLRKMVQETVRAGGAVWRGTDSVAAQLAGAPPAAPDVR